MNIGLDFNPRDALFIIGTTKIAKFKSILNTINTFSQDQCILLNPIRNTISIFTTDGKYSFTFIQFPSSVFDIIWYFDQQLDAKDTISNDIWSHPCCNLRVCRAIQHFMQEHSWFQHSFVNEVLANSVIRIPVRTSVLDTAVSTASTTSGCEKLFIYSLKGSREKLYVGYVINGGFVKHEIPIIKIPPLFCAINSQRFDASFLFDLECFKDMLYMLRQMLYETVYFDVYRHKIVLRSSGNTHTQINIHSLMCEKQEGGQYQVLSEHSNTYGNHSALTSCGPFQIENLLLFFKKKFKSQLVLIYLREDAICFESGFIESEQNRKRHKTFTNVMSRMNQSLSSPQTVKEEMEIETSNCMSSSSSVTQLKCISSEKIAENIHQMNNDYHNSNSFKLLYSVFANLPNCQSDHETRITLPIDDESMNVWE